MFEIVRSDIARGNRGLFDPAVWPVIIFRYGTWIKDYVKFKPLYVLLICSYYIIRAPIEFLTGVQIGFGARIGPGFRVHHYGCVIIAHKSVIGKNFTINQCTMIGAAGPKDGWSYPTIGDNVWVAPGAKVLGGIIVGNNVVIGTNAVVVRNVPSNVIVGGIPAKILHEGTEAWFEDSN